MYDESSKIALNVCSNKHWIGDDNAIYDVIIQAQVLQVLQLRHKKRHEIGMDQFDQSFQHMQPFSCIILPFLFLGFNLAKSAVEEYVAKPVENCLIRLVSDVICCKAIGVDMLVRLNQIDYIVVASIIKHKQCVYFFLNIQSVALPKTLWVFKKTAMSNSCATRICNNSHRLMKNKKNIIFENS